MHERVVLIGCGGIGSQLLPPLVRYLANQPEPRPVPQLEDVAVDEEEGDGAAGHGDLLALAPGELLHLRDVHPATGRGPLGGVPLGGRRGLDGG